ncbi:uncharacterized protein LOC117971182 isoform X1 [Acipenser ruthenus]|uniref:uncharacterized protein LOC117971182 isoform X1 n=1 Tax=Acipenser ruthenus TaxID=7906 RepID=UPI0027412FED|nr:uncharacterized protein LOC117971182 isoform X1 [Acipenser ruthenus]
MKRQACHSDALFFGSLLLWAVGCVKSGPLEYSVSVGGSIILNCVDSAGLRRGDVQWSHVINGLSQTLITKYSNGSIKGINDAENRFDLLTNSLLIMRIKTDDAGSYECNHQRVANLKVLVADTTKYTVSEGGSVILRCGVSHTDKSKFVTWEHTGIEDTATKTIVTRYENGATDIADEQFQLHKDSTLQIKKVKRADAGSYKCNEEVVAELQVLPGPSSGSRRPQFYVSENETVSLRCLGAETQAQTVAWTKLDVAERATILSSREPNGKFKYGHKGQDMRMQVLEDNSLTIVGVQTQDTGTYQCNRNDVADLMVLSVVLNKSSSVVEGDQVVVTCKIHDRLNNHSHTLKMSADQETPQTSQGTAITETLSAMSETDMKKTFQCRVEVGGTVRAKTSLTLQIQGTSRKEDGNERFTTPGNTGTSSKEDENERGTTPGTMGTATGTNGDVQKDNNEDSKKEEKVPFSPTITIVIILIVVLLAVLALVAAVVWKKKRNKQKGNQYNNMQTQAADMHASGSGGEAKVEKGNGDGEILYSTPQILNKKGGPTQNHQSEPCVIYSAVVTQKGK